MIHAAITGIGGYVPDYILDNEELGRMVDTTDEWIMTRIGIKERRILKGEGMGSSVMGSKAIAQLLEKTGAKPEEIDLVICATTTPDYPFPNCASMCAEKNGIKNAVAFDVHAACTGFLMALETGSNFIKSGSYKKVIVVAAEKMSSITNYEDRTTCPLFGDAAAAVLLEPTEENLGVMDTILHTDGIGLPYLHMKAGGSAYPATHETVEARQHFVYQEGQAVFKHAVTNMSDVAVGIMERNSLKESDISWFVPHQANLRIIDAVANRMGITEPEKIMVNIERYGNTSGVSVALCLWEYEQKLKKGDNLVLAAFGAGFTWGAIYLKWAYNPVTK
jgi:3-oxoacyl-[acyl-carrier-protein] synthase-3